MFEVSTPYDAKTPATKPADGRLSESGWALLVFTVVCYWLPMLVFAYAAHEAHFPAGMELFFNSGIVCVGGILLTWSVYLIYGRTSRSRHLADRRFFRTHAWIVFLTPLIIGSCAIASK